MCRTDGFISMADDTNPWTRIDRLPARPPWRPTGEDRAIMLAQVQAHAGAAESAAPVLVLGVTPEIIALPWPHGTRLVIADGSEDAVRTRWRPNAAVPGYIVCADWRALPLREGCVRAAVGDGSLNALPAFSVYRSVVQEIERTMSGGGVLILRCFVRPDRIETPEEVVSQARRGAFPHVAALRLRLGFALTGGDGALPLAKLCSAFRALVPDRDELARQTGWPRTDIDRFDLDEGSSVSLTFPTRSQLTELCGPYFEPREFLCGTYTQAADCPTVVFTSRN